MKTKTLPLFISNEDGLYIHIGVIINDNGSFKNSSKIIQTKDIKNPTNNQKRRERYKLNNERKVRLQIELNKEIEEIEKNKIMKKDKLRYESNMQEIDMSNELEDMESYI